MSTLNTIVKNMKQVKKLHPVWNLLQAAEVIEIQLEEPESGLAAWFKQAYASSTFIDDNIISEKVLQIFVHLGVDNCMGSSGWIDRFKRRHSIAY